MSRTDDLIAQAKVILPTNFVCKESDAKLQAYLELTVDDVNAVTPQTFYTLENMPAGWDNIIVFGSTLYANLFLVVNYSLKDFNYSDNGLSMTIDRHGKLSSVYDRQLKAFDQMKWNLKKGLAFKNGPAGLGTPRFQSQIGMFLKLLFGSTYSR